MESLGTILISMTLLVSCVLLGIWLGRYLSTVNYRLVVTLLFALLVSLDVIYIILHLMRSRTI